MTWYKESQKKDENEIVFRDENRGFHHGQADNTLIAYSPPGNPVGYIEYSIFDDEVSVQYIYVAEDKRLGGFGRALLLELQNRYPYTGIKLGMSTEDGSSLLEKMKTNYIPNQEYIKLKEEQENLLKRIKVLDAKAAAWFNLPPEEQEKERSRILEDGEEFNRIHDRLHEIEKELLYMEPGKTLFIS